MKTRFELSRDSASFSRRRLLAGVGAGAGFLLLGEGRVNAADTDLSTRFKAPGKLALHARRRRETAPGRIEPATEELTWNVAETAIIICDMWDKHWCAGASRRVGVLVPKMNAVVDAARSLGVLIVHAPSDTIAFYQDSPPRERLRRAPALTPPVAIESWCKIDPSSEAALPIDDSDGGCDCSPTCKVSKPWGRQHPGLDIAQEDGVSDNGAEIYNYFQQQGIKNVVLMGVHTNMCVLGRSFGIRQLRRLGYNVVLARDLTDTMYNPRQSPHVSHARGTELVVEHVERHWCPSILSADVTRVLTGSA